MTNLALLLRASLACATIVGAMFATRAFADCVDQQVDGKYGDADYTFEYQSWLRKHDPNSGNSNQDYDFGGIIRNQKPTALWVDWKEMGISGFVPFNKPKKFVIGDPTAECEIVDADLWYGDAPVLLPRVSAIRPLAKGLGSQIIHIVSEKVLAHIVSEKVLDIFKKWGKVYTVSRTDLYVPVDEQVRRKNLPGLRQSLLPR